MDKQTKLLLLNELYFHSKRPQRQDHLTKVLDMCYQTLKEDILNKEE